MSKGLKVIRLKADFTQKLPILNNMKYCFPVERQHPFTVQRLLGFAKVGLKSAIVLACCGSVWADRLPVLSPLPDAIISSPEEQATPKSDPPVSVTPSATLRRTMGNRAAETGPDFYAGIKAYREGDYRQAERIFEVLHRQQPENTQITYYLAITQAQLGRFQKAESLYREIIQLEPQGKAATLAQKGLDYLPKEEDLDLPPRFVNSPKDSPGDASEMSRTRSAQVATVSPPASAGDQTAAMAQAMRQNMQAGMQGMSPQDWMMMQMLQSQGQNNGNGVNMNPMSWMMMPGMNGAMGGGGYDPSVMSNMMMNQMMQGFGMDGNSEQNP